MNGAVAHPSIRKYQTSDQKTLLAIFRHYIPSDFASGEIDDFKQHLKTHGATYFTFELEGKLIGGIGYEMTHADSIGRIKWILFHPDYSGKGYGKLAVEHCLGILRIKPKIKKAVVTTSQLAYRFFQKFGLILEKTEKDFWGKGLDLYLLEKKSEKN